MTKLPTDIAKITTRCKTIEAAFEKFRAQIHHLNHSGDYDILMSNPSPAGFHMSQHVLFDAVVHYFRDLNRYKSQNGFSDSDLANPVKVGAFSTYWLSTKCPIYDTSDTKFASIINDHFAIFAGLTFAEIAPHKVSLLLKSKPYTQLKQTLSGRTTTPDSLVPLFELLAGFYPHEKPTSMPVVQ